MLSLKDSFKYVSGTLIEMIMVLASEKLKLSKFKYAGFEVPSLEMNGGELYANLQTEKPAYELAPQSIPLAWKTAYFLVGRDLSLGINDFGVESLPDEVKEFGTNIYNECQAKNGRGHWHKDGVRLLGTKATIKGSTRPAGAIAAEYFTDIQGFDEEGRIIPSKDTHHQNPEKIWVPEGKGRFMIYTRVGLYQPQGIPFETEENMEDALNSISEALEISAGKAKELLNRFYRGTKGDHAVGSNSYVHDGALGVGLGSGPRSWYGGVGSFPASRSLSGAKPDSRTTERYLSELKNCFF